MVESLDPHSEFLELRTTRSSRRISAASLAGSHPGGTRDKQSRGHRTDRGTPGDRAGILRGDEILSIDGKSVERDSGHDDVVSACVERQKPRWL